jgi:hypothetical protein
MGTRLYLPNYIQIGTKYYWTINGQNTGIEVDPCILGDETHGGTILGGGGASILYTAGDNITIDPSHKISAHVPDITGKQDKSDTSLNTTNKTVVGGINELNSKIEGLGSLMNFKGSVEDYTNLPTTGAEKDVYYCKSDNGSNKKGFYFWCTSDSKWEKLSLGITTDSFVTLDTAQTIESQKTFTVNPKVQVTEGGVATDKPVVYKDSIEYNELQPKTLQTPLTIDGSLKSTVEDVLKALNEKEPGGGLKYIVTNYGNLPPTTGLTKGDLCYCENDYTDTGVEPSETYYKGVYYYNGSRWKICANETDSTNYVTTNKAQSIFGLKTFIQTPQVKIPGGTNKDVLVKDTLTSTEIEEKLTGVSNAIHYKGSVTTKTALPTTGNAKNDIYYVEDTKLTYLYNDTEWIELDLSQLESIKQLQSLGLTNIVEDYSKLPTASATNDVYFALTDYTDTETHFKGLYRYDGTSWNYIGSDISSVIESNKSEIELLKTELQKVKDGLKIFTDGFAIYSDTDGSNKSIIWTEAQYNAIADTDKENKIYMIKG